MALGRQKGLGRPPRDDGEGRDGFQQQRPTRHKARPIAQQQQRAQAADGPERQRPQRIRVKRRLQPVEQQPEQAVAEQRRADYAPAPARQQRPQKHAHHGSVSHLGRVRQHRAWPNGVDSFIHQDANLAPIGQGRGRRGAYFNEEIACLEPPGCHRHRQGCPGRINADAG